MEIRISSLAEIDAAARRFLAEIGDACVVAFYAKMGAGKTTFIRALCTALGVEEPVTSPTFAIVNEYEATDSATAVERKTNKIFHFDFYRLKRAEEALDIGLDDYLESGALCLMEWPELIEDFLPADTVRVHIDVHDDGSRSIFF